MAAGQLEQPFALIVGQMNVVSLGHESRLRIMSYGRTMYLWAAPRAMKVFKKELESKAAMVAPGLSGQRYRSRLRPIEASQAPLSPARKGETPERSQRLLHS
jgi:hypothetical protein